MAAGLYSGASGLALGTGLYKGVSSLWGGASGLINGFGGGFSPTSLFAAGEQGAWYDPSDLTTMWQDYQGVTPVTAPSQSVGLILDKRIGTRTQVFDDANVTFSGPAGYAGRISPGVYEYARDAVGVGAVNFGGLVPGRSYLVSVQISAYAGSVPGIVSIRADFFNGGVAARPIGFAAGTFTFYFVPTGGSFSIRSGGSGAGGTISNVSILEVPGNHATQSNAAQRPTYGVVPAGGQRNLLTYTEQFDNAAWTKTGATVSGDQLTSITATAQVLQLQTVVSGASYTLSCKAKAGTSPYIYLAMANYDGVARVWFDLVNGAVGSATGFASGAISGPDANGFYRCEARGFSTVTDVSGSALVGLSDANSSLVSTAGRTAQAKEIQLETGSTATNYQRVGTAFDVTEAGVASRSYLSFDGSDDGMLTGNIVPGTDKAQVFAGVRKLSDAAGGVVAETSTALVSNNGTILLRAPRSAAANYLFASRGTTVAEAFPASGFAAPVTNVITGIGDIAADSAVLRVNGVVSTTSATDQGTGNYLTYPLYIGRGGGTALPLNGQIFGLIVRFGANLPAATITQTETWLGQRVSPTVNVPLWQSTTIYDRLEAAILDRNNETIEVR